MSDVLRWGRTAYETDQTLALEREAAQSLGLSWSLRQDRSAPTDLSGVRALVVPSKVRVDTAVLDRFDGSLVLTTTSGYDHVDVAACRARGVFAARCPLARRDPVVEHALARGASLMRRSLDLDRLAEHGTWARDRLDALAPRGIAGATVAVVGLGVIGSRMAEVLQGMGARVLGVDPRGGPAGVVMTCLEDALKHADLLTLHCALTPSSTRLIDGAALDRLAPHAVVVNTSRGPVLDVAAAVARVADGRLRGLVCDVFDTEPWPELASMAQVTNVCLSPHAAGFVHDLGERVAREVADNLTAWHEGRPLPGAIREDVVDGL